MAEAYEYSVVDFKDSLEASFIGSQKEADERYSPQILSNDRSCAVDVRSVIIRELSDCTSFDFSVAFITNSGIQVLIEILQELKACDTKGRILTSSYQNFNDPQALAKLLEFPNIETRVYQGDLHAKGYFFNKDQLSTIIIGSSNLTQTALTANKEWNVLFRSFSGGEFLHRAKAEFEKLWRDEETAKLSSRWISEYAKYRKAEAPRRQPKKKDFKLSDPMPAVQTHEGAQPSITPNKMQSLALEALSVLHSNSERRALLVSATGTGKTYLSALDVARTEPRKVLFVAHRQRILEASLDSFRKVLGNRYDYKLFGGGKADKNATCLFAMINTLATHLEDFSPSEFDYLIVDEAHRTGADSYQKILDYFTPKFCLGMTATPERTDGYDVYSLFNHCIAYRITLQDALENDMLAPFHYFGIADLEIGDEAYDDVSLFSKLTSEERVRHVISKINEYTVDKSNVRGLIFCGRNEEAAVLSRMFNERGYATRAISGATSDAARNSAIQELEEGKLQYLFSVDILNEGVDIPSLNQIIMLRRTESAIVFVQQLGRGLRKYVNQKTGESKEYTLVLDFIGNYQKNFLVPIALSGDRTYNKDNLRRVVKEGSVAIPGCSTISFDRVSEARVFKALEEGKFSDAKLIRSEYLHLKQVLGRIPKLCDFDANESIDPLLIIRKYRSYPAFLMKYDPDCAYDFGSKQLDYLEFISTKLANGKRLLDLQILNDLIVSRENVFEGAHLTRPNSRAAACNVLSGAFSTKGQRLISQRGAQLLLDENFKRALGDPKFKECVLDAIHFGIARNKVFFSNPYKDTDFVLYQKYSREEICKLLQWKKEPNYQNIGGYFHDKETNTFPVFINYEKDPSISITTQYEDRFISERKLIAISKSKRNLNSPEIKTLAAAKFNGLRCFLFVRKKVKDSDNSVEFYFLGEMHPTGDFKPIVLADDVTKAVEITYELEDPVRADLYDYFLSNFDEASAGN